MTIRDCSGLFRTIRDYSGLFMGLLGTIRDSRICLRGYGVRRVGVRGEVSGSNVYMLMAPLNFKSDFALKGISLVM